MKRTTKVFVFILLILFMGACDKSGPGDQDPIDTDKIPMGTLDIAFTYRLQGVPAKRLKKVDLCLAETADYLYLGKFFTCTNVSDAVTHYQFQLPPGTYYYYASVICLCAGDSCKYAGFSGQNSLMVAGGKVEVLDGQTTTYTTQFH